MQLIVLRGLYPSLWVDGRDVHATIRQELMAAGLRLRLCQLLAGGIPLVAAVVMVMAGPELSGLRAFRVLVTALVILGMVGFGWAVVLNSYLCETVAVLTRGRLRPENWSAYLRPSITAVAHLF
jgi:hypothetical protein